MYGFSRPSNQPRFPKLARHLGFRESEAAVTFDRPGQPIGLLDLALDLCGRTQSHCQRCGSRRPQPVRLKPECGVSTADRRCLYT